MTEQCTVTVAADEWRGGGGDFWEEEGEGGASRRTTFFGLLNFCVCGIVSRQFLQRYKFWVFRVLRGDSWNGANMRPSWIGFSGYPILCYLTCIQFRFLFRDFVPCAEFSAGSEQLQGLFHRDRKSSRRTTHQGCTFSLVLQPADMYLYTVHHGALLFICT